MYYKLEDISFWLFEAKKLTVVRGVVCVQYRECKMAQCQYLQRDVLN